MAQQPIEFKAVSADGKLNIYNSDSPCELRRFFPGRVCRVLHDDEITTPIELPYINGNKVWTIGTGTYGDEFYLLLDYSLSQTDPRVLANIGYPLPKLDGEWGGEINWICVADSFANFWQLMR